MSRKDKFRTWTFCLAILGTSLSLLGGKFKSIELFTAAIVASAGSWYCFGRYHSEPDEK